MTRLEMLLWASMVAAFAMPLAAKGQSPFLSHGVRHHAPQRFYGPPIGEAYSLSLEISREAAALAQDARFTLRDCHDRDEVLDELRDVYRELDHLDRALRDASRDPRRWNRICKRADELEEEICELDEEIREALEDMNRRDRRRNAFVPLGPPQYRSSFRHVPHASFGRSSGFNLSFRIGRGGITLVNDGPRLEQPVIGPELHQPRLHQPQVLPPVVDGTQLLNRVSYMRALAKQIHALAR